MTDFDRADDLAIHDLTVDEFIGRPAWMAFGNCNGADPDLFFPDRGASTREAKEVCAHCTVREQCLDYAIDNGEKFGIWGGLSERQRRRLRRDHRAARGKRRSPARQRMLTSLADAGGAVDDFRGRAWEQLDIEDTTAPGMAVLRNCVADGLVDVHRSGARLTYRIELTEAGWAWLDRPRPQDGAA